MTRYRLRQDYFMDENAWMNGRSVKVLRKSSVIKDGYYCFDFITEGDRQLLKCKLNIDYLVLSIKAAQQFNECNNIWEDVTQIIL